MGAHRVPDEGRVGRSQMLEDGLEIALETTRLDAFRVVRVAVAAKVDGDHVEPDGEGRGDVVPPVRVGTAAVEEDELGMGLAPTVDGAEGYALEGRGREAFAARVHRKQPNPADAIRGKSADFGLLGPKGGVIRLNPRPENAYDAPVRIHAVGHDMRGETGRSRRGDGDRRANPTR